jgi:hypothetical protein
LLADAWRFMGRFHGWLATILDYYHLRCSTRLRAYQPIHPGGLGCQLSRIEFEIKKRVFCELAEAVNEAKKYPLTIRKTPTGPIISTIPLIPQNWIAQVALSLQVDENTALNPGVSLNEVLPNAIKAFGVGNTVTTPQSFSLGVGATASATATRIDKFNPQYSIAFLAQKETSISVCDPKNDPYLKLSGTPPLSSPFLIESNLGIQDWLIGAMLVNRNLPSEIVSDKKPSNKPPAPTGDTCQQLVSLLCKALGTCKDAERQATCKNSSPADLKAGESAPSAAGGGIKPDTVSYETKFIIVTSGNVTPTWKLVKLSANTSSSPFFAAGRTRTHDLIITIGPNTQATDNAHLANQIGSAVSNSNRASLAPP